MIWDADTHISDSMSGGRIPAEELLRRMDENGVERALIWLHPGQTEDEWVDYDAQNRYIVRMGALYPDRFLPVGWLNPHEFSNRQEIRDYVRKLREEYGFCTIKLNGAQNFFHLLDERLGIPTIEELAGSGAKLAFHCGNDQNTRPEHVAKIASLFPDTPILLVHMGQTENDAAIEAAAAHPNILLVGSGMPDYAPVARAVRRLGSDRVCYGSDAPFGDMAKILQAYQDVLAHLSAEEKQRVMWENLARFFDE